MCEIGRYCNIPYEQRLCRLCEMNKMESEHHFLLSSSDPAVQTQLAAILFKALEKRKQSKVYSYQFELIYPLLQTLFKFVIIFVNVDVNTNALTLMSVKGNRRSKKVKLK